MAGVDIVLAASNRGGGGHRRVTLTGHNGTVTLDITSPELDLAGLADDWQEVPIPGRKPYLMRAGKRLPTISMEATIGRDGDGRERDVTADLMALAVMASPVTATSTVVLGYSRLEGSATFAPTGWRITDLSIRTVRRRPDNTVSRARVALTLTAASDPVTPQLPGSASTPSSARTPALAGSTTTPAAVPARSSTTSSATARRHTVRAGDTLWTIAATYYGGDTSRWSAIAEANGIRDPRRLAIGTVLTLP